MSKMFDKEINAQIVKLIEQGLETSVVAQRVGLPRGSIRARYRYQKGLQAGLSPIEAKKYVPGGDKGVGAR